MESFQFDAQQYSDLIWIFPVIWGAVTVFNHFQSKKTQTQLGSRAYSFLTQNQSQTKRRIKNVLLFLTWIFLVISLMGPRWGYKAEKVTQQSLDMMICVDVSRSMLAQDVAPNRLERIKLDLKDLIGALQGDRVGLIVFAGAAVSQCPLTLDRQFLIQSLSSLSPESAPRGGTFIGDAIRKALNSFTKSEGRNRIILIVTDGEDQDSLPLEAARQAAAQKVKIFTIGIGNENQGTPIPTFEKGLKKYLTYQGETVLSKLNSQPLKEIAKITDGAYIPARTSLLQLDEIYRKFILSLDRSKNEQDKINRLQPQFKWFLAIGIILLTLEMILGTRRKN